MKHSPCCGRIKALRAQVDKLTTERDTYRDALVSISEYWNRSENDKAMNDALYYMIDTAESALTRHTPTEGT